MFQSNMADNSPAAVNLLAKAVMSSKLEDLIAELPPKASAALQAIASKTWANQMH